MNFSGEKYSVKFESVVYSLEQGKELSFALQSSVHITTLVMVVSRSGKPILCRCCDMVPHHQGGSMRVGKGERLEWLTMEWKDARVRSDHYVCHQL